MTYDLQYKPSALKEIEKIKRSRDAINRVSTHICGIIFHLS